VDRRALVIGVFVNESWEVIEEIMDRFSLDAIQLHGSERAQDVPATLRDMPIIKAISWRAETRADIDIAMNWTGEPALGSLKGFLVDAYDPIQFGGTGKVVRWDLLYPRPPELCKNRLILAGGLTPENLAQAINRAVPDAIDTASGIESSPGMKSAERMKKFVDEARKVVTDNGRWLAELL